MSIEAWIITNSTPHYIYCIIRAAVYPNTLYIMPLYYQAPAARRDALNPKPLNPTPRPGALDRSLFELNIAWEFHFDVSWASPIGLGCRGFF